MTEPSGRQGLLDRVVDHMLETGTATDSLRALAAEIGSSHRMLIYHFGNLHGLVQAVVGEVEVRQRAALADLAEMPETSAAAISHAFWKRLASRNMRPVERLFFQLHARLLELGDEETASRLLTEWIDSAVRSSLRAATPRPMRAGSPGWGSPCTGVCCWTWLLPATSALSMRRPGPTST